MLADVVRNEAYRHALLRAVQPGDAVLDVGAGTGVLSLFAAAAGARRVYAVERARVAQIQAVRSVRAIEVIRADILRARLPEKVDVLVSEWMGAYGVDENLLLPTLIARDRWLAPGGLIVPGRVTAWLAPVEPAPGLVPVAGGRMWWARSTLATGLLVAPGLQMWTTDVTSVPAAQALLPARAALRFKAARDATVGGLVAWFSADLCGISLTNAPGAPPTHWGEFVFPLARPVQVDQGAEIAVRFACLPARPGAAHHSWSVRIAERDWEHHDTRVGQT